MTALAWASPAAMQPMHRRPPVVMVLALLLFLAFAAPFFFHCEALYSDRDFGTWHAVHSFVLPPGVLPVLPLLPLDVPALTAFSLPAAAAEGAAAGVAVAMDPPFPLLLLWFIVAVVKKEVKSKSNSESSNVELDGDGDEVQRSEALVSIAAAAAEGRAERASSESRWTADCIYSYVRFGDFLPELVCRYNAVDL